VCPTSPGSTVGNVMLWALLTGGVTGAVWTAIVLINRQRRLAAEQRALQLELERRMNTLEDVTAQLSQLEERLDFAERMLQTEREKGRLRSGEADADGGMNRP